MALVEVVFGLAARHATAFGLAALHAAARHGAPLQLRPFAALFVRIRLARPPEG